MVGLLVACVVGSVATTDAYASDAGSVWTSAYGTVPSSGIAWLPTITRSAVGYVSAASVDGVVPSEVAGVGAGAAAAAAAGAVGVAAGVSIGTAPMVSMTTGGCALVAAALGFAFFFAAGGFTTKVSFTTGTRICRVAVGGWCDTGGALDAALGVCAVCAVGSFGTPSEGNPTPGTRSTGRRAAAGEPMVLSLSVARRIAGSV